MTIGIGLVGYGWIAPRTRTLSGRSIGSRPFEQAAGATAAGRCVRVAAFRSGAAALESSVIGDVSVNEALRGPAHPDFVHFQPGPGIPMGYDDVKVIEAYLFLRSIADGRQREPGVRENESAARVLDAILRSCESSGWEKVRGPLPAPAD